MLILCSSSSIDAHQEIAEWASVLLKILSLVLLSAQLTKLYLGYFMTGVAPGTITNWTMYFSDLVGLDVEEHHEMIGGPGIEVEIDESKFGKRRAHRGHRVDGVWVVGAVERTAERRMFAVPVADRTEPTLTALIRRDIHPESYIFSDC